MPRHFRKKGSDHCFLAAAEDGNVDNYDPLKSSHTHQRANGLSIIQQSSAVTLGLACLPGGPVSPAKAPMTCLEFRS